MNAGPAVGAASTSTAAASANLGSIAPGPPNPSPAPDAFRALLARQWPGVPALLGPQLLAAPPSILAPRAQTGTRPTLLGLSCVGLRRNDPGEDDPLDPLRRHRAALQSPEILASCVTVAPATTPSASSVPPVDPARGLVSLEDLLPTLVRRIAWSGDATRGTARLEIGSGVLAGATLLVAADGGRVQVHLNVPAGVDASSWQARIRRRLESRSIIADTVEVT